METDYKKTYDILYVHYDITRPYAHWSYYASIMLPFASGSYFVKYDKYEKVYSIIVPRKFSIRFSSNDDGMCESEFCFPDFYSLNKLSIKPINFYLTDIFEYKTYQDKQIPIALNKKFINSKAEKLLKLKTFI